MEGNDNDVSFAGLSGGDAGDLGAGSLGGDTGDAGDFGVAPDASPLEAFGGAGQTIDPAPDAAPDAAPVVGADANGIAENPTSTDPLEPFGGPGTDLNPTPEVATKTPEERLEELIGPDPLAFMKNGPTGFYGLDSGLETIEGLKEEFITVARCLAHWYIKTDGMRGAPAANLAMERLLPHYPELHGIIKMPPLPPLPPEKPRTPVAERASARQVEDQNLRAPVQFAAVNDDTDFTFIGPGQVGQADETPIQPSTASTDDETPRLRALLETIGEEAKSIEEEFPSDHKLAFALLDHMDHPDFAVMAEKIGIPADRMLAARLIHDAQPGEFDSIFTFLRDTLIGENGVMIDSALLFQYEMALAQIIGSPGFPNGEPDGSPESRRDAVLHLLSHTAMSGVRKAFTEVFQDGIVGSGARRAGRPRKKGQFVPGLNTKLVPPRDRRRIKIDLRQSEKKFGEKAQLLGISGRKNPANIERFRRAIRAYVEDPTTIPISGSYRGQSVTYFYNRPKKTFVLRTRGGRFLTVLSYGPGSTANPIARKIILKKGRK